MIVNNKMVHLEAKLLQFCYTHIKTIKTKNPNFIFNFRAEIIAIKEALKQLINPVDNIWILRIAKDQLKDLQTTHT